MIPLDISEFVNRLAADAVGQGFNYLRMSDAVARREVEKFGRAFGVEPPASYVEICKIRDGFTDSNMACLHGLQTLWRPDEEFPDYEGLLDIHERQMIDGVGRGDFIEFGNRDGVEPWGWDLTLRCFIRSDPNPLTGVAMRRFDSFDEMFRSLFRLLSS